MKTPVAAAFIALLGLITIWLMGCASVQDREEEDVHLQETKTFEGFTFGEVWDAALRSVVEIDFVVQKRLLKSGFIYAQGKEGPDSLYLPPHMNIYVRQKSGRITVHCHAVIPEDPSNYEFSSSYVEQFFTALYKNLN